MYSYRIIPLTKKVSMVEWIDKTKTAKDMIVIKIIKLRNNYGGKRV